MNIKSSCGLMVLVAVFSAFLLWWPTTGLRTETCWEWSGTGFGGGRPGIWESIGSISTISRPAWGCVTDPFERFLFSSPPSNAFLEAVL